MALINKLQRARDVVRRQLGRWLFDRTRERPADEDKSKVVLLRWDAKLGDSIVSSWVAREIHKAQPEREVWVVTTSGMAPLFRDYFGVDRVIEIAKRPSYGELKQLAHRLGRVSYLVHLSKLLKMKDIYFLNQVDACHVAGIDDALTCIDIKLGARTAGRHFADKFAELLLAMGITSPDTRYIIPARPEWDVALAQWWPADQAVIAFNPYGNGRARRLRPASIIAMLNIMLARGAQSICLLFPPGLAQEAMACKASVTDPSRLLLSPESPSLGGLFTQIRHSVGLVSVDTATVHIAAGLSVPVLGLYNPDLGGGSENFDEWHPNQPDATVLFSTASEMQDINSLDMQAFEHSFTTWVASSVNPPH
ncbi:glycosyltransferase family 9 protein [Aeromonas cavernicola]|uniref:Lipooligosaccharided-glycero-D-manno-heptosyltransferase n=1 Tax=Aeromonas cavernicola TaxID=1006623 RepID=A0A2H9U8J6_9GAMM|nr:glycosyltransferase family 9 protein [Aeromonas cavernicola]PJG60299.1 lipooligosaccharided-glycero-D-manno-heptosyltransferase [Aeromonas cavernicola]